MAKKRKKPTRARGKTASKKAKKPTKRRRSGGALTPRDDGSGAGPPH